MSKSISSSPMSQKHSSRSAGAGCPCRFGKGSGGSPPRYIVKKVLLVVLSLSVFFSLLAIYPSATFVEEDVNYFSSSYFGYTFNSGVLRSNDDSLAYKYSYYTNNVYLSDTNFLDDGYFLGDSLSDGVMCSYRFDYIYSPDFYLYEPSISFDSFYFTDSDSVSGILSDFWYNLTILFDGNIFDSTYIECSVDFFDTEDDLQTLSIDFPLGSNLDTNIGELPVVIPLVDDNGLIHVANCIRYVLGMGGIGYVLKDYPAVANFTFTMRHGEILYGDSIYIHGIPDDIYSGSVQDYAYALRQYGVDVGWEVGHDVGFNQGLVVGEQRGYADGYNAGQSSEITADGIGGLLSDAVSGFLDTNIFGSISIGDILLCVCGIALVLIFLKFFAGG